MSVPRLDGRGGQLLLAVVFVLGIICRFVRLDADPHYYDWIGYITDEGRWVDQARELALFGRSNELRPTLHMVVAPLFQATSYVVFRLFDISILSSRLISAASGSALLLTFWLGLSRVTSPTMLMVPVAMLAFTEDLIVLSRVAVPEMTVMAAHLLVYLMLVADARRSVLLPLAGAATLVSVGIKLTALPVAGIFALIVLTQPRDPSWAGSRWRDFTAFLAGLLVPLVAIAALLASRGPSGLVARIEAQAGALVSPNSLYGAVVFVFDDPMAASLNLWLLALWCSLIGWLAAGPLVDGRSRRLLVTSLTWAGAYAVMMLGLSYFPNRYKLHVVVPIAVASAVGLSLLQRAGRERIDAIGAGGRGLRSALTAGFLGLPTAVMIAPLLAVLLGLRGGDPTRLQIRILSIGLAVSLTGLVLGALGGRRPSSIFLIVFPVTAALIWSTAQRTGIYELPFWATAAFVRHAAGWLVLLLASGSVASAAAAYQSRSSTLGLAGCISAVWYVALCLPALVPTIITPHYSIRSASRHLAVSLADVAEPIESSGADGLFREGRLRYRIVWGRTWPAARPDVVAIAFDFRDPEGLLGRDYCLTDVFPLYVSPMYFRVHPLLSPTSRLGESVRIYRRRGVAGCRARSSRPGSRPDALAGHRHVEMVHAERSQRVVNRVHQLP